MLRHIRPSVYPFVCSSFTLQYCVKMREHRRMRSSPSGSPVSRLPERDYVTFGSLLSPIRLSSVVFLFVCLSETLMHPTEAFEAFNNISSPLCTLAILWPMCKILRRSSQGNPSVGALNATGVASMSYSIEGYIS